MSKARRQGFILTYVIVLLGLVGVVMFVLTGGANTMLFQADAAYLQAVDRNLAASALVWARHQASQAQPAVSGQLIPLDTSSLAVSRAGVAVRITERDNATVGCRIETSVARGRQSISEVRKYVLSAR
jgi:hypothetical protein